MRNFRARGRCVAARSGWSVCLAVCAFLAAVTPARADEWVSIGPFAGRTATALLGESFAGGTFLYAAIEGVGVFRSGDRGSTWTQVDTGLTNTHVSDFAAHYIGASCPPPCWGPGIIYAGTRGGGVFVLRNDRWTADNSGLTDLEVNVLAADSNGVWAGTAGGQLFRTVFSAVGPQTWSRMGPPVDGTAVLSLVFAGSDSTLFLGTVGGLYRSKNGGLSWSPLLADGLQYFASVRAIAVDPRHTATIYAAGIFDCRLPCEAPAYPAIVKSTDGGETWTPINGDIANPSVSSIVVTYPGSLFVGTESGVFRSIDGGSIWTSTGLEGLSVAALAQVPPEFPATEALMAGTVGGGVYRRDFAVSTCSSDSLTLCLRGGRFRVGVSWRIREGRQRGEAERMPLTSESGAFWFFQPSNIELVVKVLDGRAINGHYWFFWGALTNVGYTITVTDTVTGTVKTYTNPEGQLASGADTEAF